MGSELLPGVRWGLGRRLGALAHCRLSQFLPVCPFRPQSAMLPSGSTWPQLRPPARLRLPSLPPTLNLGISPPPSALPAPRVFLPSPKLPPAPPGSPPSPPPPPLQLWVSTFPRKTSPCHLSGDNEQICTPPSGSVSLDTRGPPTPPASPGRVPGPSPDRLTCT